VERREQIVLIGTGQELTAWAGIDAERIAAAALNLFGAKQSITATSE
jgi:hypothetical protein